jgi:hypothetical protein
MCYVNLINLYYSHTTNALYRGITHIYKLDHTYKAQHKAEAQNINPKLLTNPPLNWTLQTNTRSSV